MNWNRFIKFGVSLLFVICILYFVNPITIINGFKNFRWGFIPLILFVYLLSFVIGSFNINIFLRALGHKLSFFKVLWYTILSWSFGLIGPGKIGEFSIIYFLKKDGVPVGEGLSVSFFDKIISLVVLCFFCFVMSYFLGLKIILFVFFVLFITILIVYIFLNKSIVFLFDFWFFKKFKPYIKSFIRTNKLLLTKRKFAVLLNVIVTFIKYFVGGVCTTLIFYSFGVHAGFFNVALIASSLIIINLVPFTIQGIGLKEAVAVYLYGKIGISAAVVVSTYLLYYIMAYSITLIVFIYVINNGTYMNHKTPKRSNH